MRWGGRIELGTVYATDAMPSRLRPGNRALTKALLASAES
jgi:hypothetical protein